MLAGRWAPVDRRDGGVVTELPGWLPQGVDITVPNASRMYDYALGGYHNFEVDRRFWAQVEKLMPQARFVAYANRAFLGRAVRWLVDAGVRQFLDIGSGIPTLGNVHEVAQRAAADARVVYVDIDSIAVEQSRSILAGSPRALAIQGDLRRPDEILYHPDVLELLDFSQPVAVLAVAVLHFIPDTDDPAGIIRRLSEPLVSGSYLAVSHLGPEPDPELREAQDRVRRLYESTPTPVVVRTVDEVTALLGGLELIEPGVTAATNWHPDPDAGDDSAQPTALVAVARKP